MANILVAAGKYIFEVVIPDYNNFDLAKVVFKPALAILKQTPFVPTLPKPPRARDVASSIYCTSTSTGNALK